MTEHDHTFDNRPDPELGAALRAALEPGEPTPFVRRVLELVDRTRGWGVLAAWARRGIAAAAVAALLAGALVEGALRLGGADDALAGLIDAATTTTAEAALLASEGAPDPTALLAPLFEP